MLPLEPESKKRKRNCYNLISCGWLWQQKQSVLTGLGRPAKLSWDAGLIGAFFQSHMFIWPSYSVWDQLASLIYYLSAMKAAANAIVVFTGQKEAARRCSRIISIYASASAAGLRRRTLSQPWHGTSASSWPPVGCWRPTSTNTRLSHWVSWYTVSWSKAKTQKRCHQHQPRSHRFSLILLR